MRKKIEDLLEKRKADIVISVLHLADKHGIRGITTKKIAEEVGFVEGALYKHIKSKHEVFLTILEISEQLIEDQFNQIQEMKLKANEALRHWFRFAMAYLEEFPGVYRILFSDELYIENKDFFQKFKDITHFSQEQFEIIVRQGMKENIFRKEIKPELVSILYLGVIDIAFTVWNLFEERKKRLQEFALPIFDEFLNSLLAKEIKQ